MQEESIVCSMAMLDGEKEPLEVPIRRLQLPKADNECRHEQAWFGGGVPD